MKIETEFKQTDELKNFLKKCEVLDFETLKPGTDGKLIKFINEAQVTPYQTGFTQEHNEIQEDGNAKVLTNTNMDYGPKIYNITSNDYFIPHHDIKGSEKNSNPMGKWFEMGDGDYSRITDFVVDNIKKEIEEE